MFYKFDINGIYCGKSRSKEERSTKVSPPDENETATWVWNHVNWVGLPLEWKPTELSITSLIDNTPPVENLPEENPSA